MLKEHSSQRWHSTFACYSLDQCSTFVYVLLFRSIEIRYSFCSQILQWSGSLENTHASECDLRDWSFIESVKIIAGIVVLYMNYSHLQM